MKPKGPPLPPGINLPKGPPLPPGMKGPPLPPGAPKLPGLPGMIGKIIGPSKAKCKPRVAMKPVQITIIDANKMKKSIWSTIDDSKIKLDIDFLEQEF